jgi:hypothetical protein
MRAGEELSGQIIRTIGLVFLTDAMWGFPSQCDCVGPFGQDAAVEFLNSRDRPFLENPGDPFVCNLEPAKEFPETGKRPLNESQAS